MVSVKNKSSMLSKPYINFLLWINKFFPEEGFPHPFNQSEKGAYNLNYSSFEYKSAPNVFKTYDAYDTFDNIFKNNNLTFELIIISAKLNK